MASLRQLIRAQAEAKAFNPNPAWEDPGRPVGFVDLNLGRIAGQSPSRGVAGQRVTQANSGRYLNAYAGKTAAMDWVMDCVRYWADTVSSAEYHFEKPNEEEDKKLPGKPSKPPVGLKKLFEDPNPYMDYIELMELLVMDLFLTGNAYWFKWRVNGQKQPLAMYRLAPNYVEIATNPWGPEAYIYQIPNADKILIEPEEIVHFKLANPDPENPFYGAGILQGAGAAADLEISLTQTQSSYYENHAMPSMAVESERRVPRDVFKKMRAQLRSRAGGPRNAGELLVLEAGLKLNPLSPSATDAAFVAVSKMSRDRVFSWFKMHPSMVNLVDENITGETLQALVKQFDTKAARPFMNKLEKKITSQLVENWQLKYVIDYEYQMSPQERATYGGMVGQLPGVLVEETRQAGGFGPHPEKEIGEMTLNLPGEEGGTGQPGEDPTRKGHADRNLPGEPGRPPKAGNTKAFPKGGSQLPKGSAARKPKPKGKALGVSEVLSRLELLTPHDREPVDQLENKRVADVDAVTASFEADLTRAAHVLERGLLDTVEGKAMDYSDIVAKLRNSKYWANFDELAKDAYERALLKVMSAAAVHHGQIGLRPAGEIDYEALIDELATREDSGVKAISKSFKDIISKTVKEARAEKRGIDSAVQEAVQKWTRDNASMIAITEATRGYNESTLAVADKSGFTHVLVTDGDQDDAPCIEANGSTWTLEYAKDHSVQHPRCRRAFIPTAS